MRLYFLRHAEAEDGPVDAGRALTSKGRRDARGLGRYLKATEIDFTHAFASPLVRARETAEIVLEACPVAKRGKLMEAVELLNGATVAGFRRWVGTLPDDSSVLLVGHEPSMSGHVRRFLGISSAGALVLPKCAIIRIDSADHKTGALKWFMGPKQLP